MKNGVELKCEEQAAEKRKSGACSALYKVFCMEAIVEYFNVSLFDWTKRQSIVRLKRRMGLNGNQKAFR